MQEDHLNLKSAWVREQILALLVLNKNLTFFYMTLVIPNLYGSLTGKYLKYCLATISIQCRRDGPVGAMQIRRPEFESPEPRRNPKW